MTQQITQVLLLLFSISTLPSSIPGRSRNAFDEKMEEAKTSRQRGLEELDSLGEAAIQSVLSGSSRKEGGIRQI
jgi:hypothetical protein